MSGQWNVEVPQCKGKFLLNATAIYICVCVCVQAVHLHAYNLKMMKKVMKYCLVKIVFSAYTIFYRD